ncbi:MAG: hypothetical protein A2Y95_03700 [Deltaproteobacteria bacterium RBG_13_65_10]|jgi:PAS domain S-box-containing protein|nr:MAG: hypothetical protein A2Y95_03700 [Deltaproteobacteria bacterium RBG_13_65_10]
MGKFDPTKKGFAEEIGFNDQERAEREAFLRITPEEVALLRSLGPVIEPKADSIVRTFYEHLLRFRETRELLSDERVRNRLLAAQREYLQNLFSGNYGPDYYESRIRIGFTHDRIRLLPKWYLGAYALYISLLDPVIREHFRGNPLRADEAMLAVHKVLNLDMQLAMDAYILSSQEQLELSNRELESLTRELDNRIQQRTRELVASEARYRSTIEMSPNLIYQVEPGGRFEQLNRTLLARLGYTRKELSGRKHNIIVAPEQRETYLAEIERTRESGRHQFETVLATRDGQRVEAEASSVQVDPNLPNSPIRVYLRDVTERNRMMRQVQQAQKLAAVGQLASVLAHEVRNPLNAMGLHLTLLQRRAEDAEGEARESMQRAIASVRREVNRLDELVNDFLLLARPGDLRRAEADLHPIIDEVLNLERPRADRLGIQMKRCYDESVPQLPLDADKLKQALLNLVTNALDVMSSGGTITLRTKRLDGSVRIEVQDTGPGIPTGVNVFELFFTTKSRGTGMGLNIVEGIIQQHGGHVDVSSREGKGTTFILDLPLGPSGSVGRRRGHEPVDSPRGEDR